MTQYAIFYENRQHSDTYPTYDDVIREASIIGVIIVIRPRWLVAFGLQKVVFADKWEIRQNEDGANWKTFIQ